MRALQAARFLCGPALSARRQHAYEPCCNAQVAGGLKESIGTLKEKVGGVFSDKYAGPAAPAMTVSLHEPSDLQHVCRVWACACTVCMRTHVLLHVEVPALLRRQARLRPGRLGALPMSLRAGRRRPARSSARRASWRRRPPTRSSAWRAPRRRWWARRARSWAARWPTRRRRSRARRSRPRRGLSCAVCCDNNDCVVEVKTIMRTSFQPKSSQNTVTGNSTTEERRSRVRRSRPRRARGPSMRAGWPRPAAPGLSGARAPQGEVKKRTTTV